MVRFQCIFQPILVCVTLLLQGNNEGAIEQLQLHQDSIASRGFVSFDEAFKCAKNQGVHWTLRSRYVELILVMYVAVGENRSFLDHLCYSFVSTGWCNKHGC